MLIRMAPMDIVPVTASTCPTSSDDKLSPPYFLSLSAHREKTWNQFSSVDRYYKIKHRVGFNKCI
jgi:hypothetical protein